LQSRVEAPSLKPLQKCEGFFDLGSKKHRNTLSYPCGCTARCAIIPSFFCLNN
jgi:hypothetical protein